MEFSSKKLSILVIINIVFSILILSFSLYIYFKLRNKRGPRGLRGERGSRGPRGPPG